MNFFRDIIQFLVKPSHSLSMDGPSIERSDLMDMGDGPGSSDPKHIKKKDLSDITSEPCC